MWMDLKQQKNVQTTEKFPIYVTGTSRNSMYRSITTQLGAMLCYVQRVTCLIFHVFFSCLYVWCCFYM